MESGLSSRPLHTDMWRETLSPPFTDFIECPLCAIDCPGSRDARINKNQLPRVF